MAAYVHQPYQGWSQEELPEQNEFQEVSTSNMLDHGSISFGRYACEPISWEKRSVFTFNRHQEELEKFKSHGLVAKKKAYFEEYYKKIRAMKALENHQTEITLDYSDVGSNKSQIEEEEVPLENSIKVAGKCREVEAPSGHTISGFDSSSNNSVVDQQQDEIVSTCQKNLEVDISINQLLEVSTEETKQIDVCPLDNKEASRNIALDYSDVGSNIIKIEEEEVPIERSIKVVDKYREEAEAPCGLSISDFDSSSNNSVVEKQQEEIINAYQKNLEVNISVDQALEVSIEEAKQIGICSLKCKEASRENKSPIAKVELEIVTKESKSVAENIFSRNVKMKLDQETLVPRKVTGAVRKHKDTTSITKMKEPSAPARYSSKLENKAKLDNEESTVVPKIIRKADVKLVNGVDSGKNYVHKVPKNNRSTNVSRPFSPAINKRVSNSSQGRELCSKTSNLKMSSTVKGKEPINALNTSKRIAPVKSIISTKTEEKRLNSDIKKPTYMKVENRISLKERDTNVPSASKKKRSSSLPRDRVRSGGVNDIELKPGFNVNKHEATRHESKAKEVYQVDPKSFSSLGTTQASEIKKIARSRPCGSRPGTGVQSHNARKNPEQENLKDMQQKTRTPMCGSRPGFGGQSHNARKNLELEKPRWR